MDAPLMPSQQSSFRPSRTALTPDQEAIAATDAASDGPSKMPPFWTHMYSVPERLTPWRVTTLPSEFTRWFPATWIGSSAAAAVGCADALGEGVAGVGSGV